MENEREKNKELYYLHMSILLLKKEEEYIKVATDLLCILALFNFLTNS